MTNVKQAPEQVETRTIVRWLVRETLGVVVMGVVLFVSAGTIRWPMGWVLVGLMALWVAAMALAIVPRHPALIAERLGPQKNAKRWDTAVMSIVGLLTFAKLIVAGLDLRFGWTTTIGLPLQLAMLAVAVLGYGLVVWATAVNAYFSQIVRIQTERDHHVVDDGPYQFIRHPGNLGSILFELATPIMLGSWWALVPGAVAAALILLRTALEDRALQEELPGYDTYTLQTRYRLLPGIW